MTISKMQDLKILIDQLFFNVYSIVRNACIFSEYVQESQHQLQKATFAVIHS